MRLKTQGQKGSHWAAYIIYAAMPISMSFFAHILHSKQGRQQGSNWGISPGSQESQKLTN